MQNQQQQFVIAVCLLVYTDMYTPGQPEHMFLRYMAAALRLHSSMHYQPGIAL
jgi:hypothetical protein